MFNKIEELLFSITAKNFYWITTSSALVALSTFIFTILIARNFDPSVLGLFSTISSLILIFSDLGELGTGDALIRFLPHFIKEKNTPAIKKVLKTVFLFQLLIALAIATVLILFAQQFSQWLFHSTEPGNIQLIKLSSLGVVSFILFYYVNNATVSFERFRKTFILQILYGFSKVVMLGVFLVLLTNVNLFLIILSFIAGPLVAFIIGSTFIPVNFIKIDGFYSLKKILSFSLFLAVNRIFVALFSRFDYLMLTALSGAYETGLYAVASRVAFIYPLIGSSLGTVIGPKYARLNLNESINFSKKVFFLIFLLILSLFIVILISPFIISLFGSSYNNSLPVLQLLLISNIPFLLSIPTNNFLTYTIKKPQVIAFSSLIQLGIIFLTNLILIPKLGRFAPAISIGVAAFVSMIISYTLTIFYLNKR